MKVYRNMTVFGAAVLLLFVILLTAMRAFAPDEYVRMSVTDTRFGSIIEVNASNVMLEFVDSVPPSRDDESIVLAVAGAFTGQRLEKYDPFNICGNYVTYGKEKRGYPSKYCTGYCASFRDTVIIGKENIAADKAMAAESGGFYFQQLLLVHKGKVESYIPFSKSNLYRALCLRDGNICVMQSASLMNCRDFANALAELGVSEALYLDMGSWGWGWMRERDGRVSDLNLKFSDTRYQTNWVVLRKLKNGK